MRKFFLLGLPLIVLVCAPAVRAQEPRNVARIRAIPVYRVSSATLGHLYTTDFNEAEGLVRTGQYVMDGHAFNVAERPAPGLVPLYRFVKESGVRFLDTSRPAGGRLGGRVEMVLGYVSPRPRPSMVALY